jgi:hypothetical protein
MSVDGVIAERTRGLLPVTWNALSSDSRYGDVLISQTIDFVKAMVFGEVVLSDDEGTYPVVVIDYIAKLAAIELCTPGIDFWMNEPVSESATGTNENHTFTERVAALQELRRNLIEQTRAVAGDIASIVGFRLHSPRRARINTLDDEFLTPSPQEFPRPFIRTAFS